MDMIGLSWSMMCGYDTDQNLKGFGETTKSPGWEFTKLLLQICKSFLNFKVLLRSSFS